MHLFPLLQHLFGGLCISLSCNGFEKFRVGGVREADRVPARRYLKILHGIRIVPLLTHQRYDGIGISQTVVLMLNMLLLLTCLAQTTLHSAMGCPLLIFKISCVVVLMEGNGGPC